MAQKLVDFRKMQIKDRILQFGTLCLIFIVFWAIVCFNTLQKGAMS